MKIRQGWSGEVKPNRWAKFDICLEEEDLRRLLGPGYQALRNLNTSTAFQLLELEAERLVLIKLISRYGYEPDEGKSSVDKLEQQKRVVRDQIWAAGK